MVFVLYSEKLFMQMADHLAGDGFKDVGYEFINIDVGYSLCYEIYTYIQSYVHTL